MPPQAPAWQVSSCVQAFPSLQVTCVPAVHVPAWQLSACVQAFPSSQVLPSGRAGLEHIPVAGLHVPASWH